MHTKIHIYTSQGLKNQEQSLSLVTQHTVKPSIYHIPVDYLQDDPGIKLHTTFFLNHKSLDG